MVLKWKRLKTFTELDGILIPPRQNTVTETSFTMMLGLMQAYTLVRSYKILGINFL